MKFKDRKYLRKKSLRVQEYLLFGLSATVIYFFARKYNQRINPPEKSDLETQSVSVHPAELMWLQVQKYYNLTKAYYEVRKYDAMVEAKQLKQKREEEKVAEKQEEQT